MGADETDRILDRIDAAVGPPEVESDDEHEARRQMIERDATARAIRRQGREGSAPPPSRSE